MSTLVGLSEVTKVHGDRVVLDRVTLGVGAGERVGVIGVNGSGKSTLLRVAAGQRAHVFGADPRHLDVLPDAGSVVHARDARLHMVGQEPQLPGDATPVQAVLTLDTPAVAAARRFAAASRAARQAPGDERVLAELEAATADMDARGGWEVEARARAVLDRLGVADVEAPIGGRSGGEVKRIALAAALAEPPDVLILDEPTNHLDVDAVEWLQGELTAWSGALMLVTHDRYLLDAVATRVVEVHRGRLHDHHGGYTSYLQARELRREQATAEARRTANRARAELAYLRQGPKARASKSKQRVRQAQAAVAAAENVDTDEPELQLELPTPRLGGKVVNLHRAGVRMPDGPWILREVDWKLGPDERMGVVGPNGSGKTTLLRLLAGEVEPDAGSRRAGETVRVGFYRQQAAPLDPATRVRDVVENEVRTTQLASGHRITAGQLLERFAFEAAQQRALVGELSGGERRRLELLRVLAGAPNLLLLDEPTNDLDLDTLGALEDYLDQWPGAVVVASHDRFLLDRVCGQVLALDDGRVTHHPGGWRDWRAVLADRHRSDRRRDAASAGGREIGGGQAATSGRSQREPRARKRSYREERELAQAEQRIEELTRRREELNAELAAGEADHQRAGELGRELADVTAELEALEERWLELSLIGEAS